MIAVIVGSEKWGFSPDPMTISEVFRRAKTQTFPPVQHSLQISYFGAAPYASELYGIARINRGKFVLAF